jgi:hypothetical protein
MSASTRPGRFSATTCCAWVRVAGGAADVVAERAHEVLELHRDQRFVLDDQHVGRRLALDLVDRFLDQAVHVVFGDFHDLAGFGRAEKSSTVVSSSAWRLIGVILRNCPAPRFRAAPARALLGDFEVGARPHLVERAVERHAPAAQRLGESSSASAASSVARTKASPVDCEPVRARA